MGIYRHWEVWSSMIVHPSIAILINAKGHSGPPVEKVLIIMSGWTASQVVPQSGPPRHPRLSRQWGWHTYPWDEGRYPLEEERTNKAPIAKKILPAYLTCCQLGADRCKHADAPVIHCGSHAL
jgi:hypothetical protein